MYLINVFLNNVIMNSNRTAEDVGPYVFANSTAECEMGNSMFYGQSGTPVPTMRGEIHLAAE